MSDSQPVQTPPPSSPFDHLPLWLRDWRVFALLLLLLVLGGQGAGDAIRGLLGVPVANSPAATCCQTLEPRLQALEAGVTRLLAYCRAGGRIPTGASGAASPSSAAREGGTLTAVGSVP